MTTQLSVEHTAFTPGSRRALRDQPHDHLFLVAASVALVIVALGFGLEFAPGAPSATRPRTALIVAHATVFASWIVLFAVQVSLVAIGRTSLHRKLGVAGALLGVSMLTLGFATAIRAARTGYAPVPGVDALAFLVVPVGDLVVFAALVGSALYWRRTAEVHKRLMWLATASLTFPAIVRLPYVRGNGPVIFALFLALLLFAPVYERVVRGRVHRVFVWGTAAVFLSVPIRHWIGSTNLWRAIANWLIS